MKTYLYLDDERTPKTDHPWVVVRSYVAAVSYVIQHGVPAYISFDHDLGTTESGYDFAKWLVEQDISKIYMLPENFEYNVHSANPVGRVNIEEYLRSYLDYKNATQTTTNT